MVLLALSKLDTAMAKRMNLPELKIRAVVDVRNTEKVKGLPSGSKM